MAHAAYKLVDTTLREGERFARASFRTQDKIEIARALDTFGVDYIEVTSPAASPRSQRDAARIAGLALGARVITHSRCVVDDVRAALDAGVRAIGFFFATSRILREASHGRSIPRILEALAPPVELALSEGLEVRFSAEDAFRSEGLDVLAVLQAADRMGVHRVGIADTVGTGAPGAHQEDQGDGGSRGPLGVADRRRPAWMGHGLTGAIRDPYRSEKNIRFALPRARAYGVHWALEAAGWWVAAERDSPPRGGVRRGRHGGRRAVPR
jgi:hypothetical protein